ncbi:MAG: DNA mismatch repair endonuclease MutL [Clostridia bacterium]|nr:DNA mismatch repair endonuclease MutL [Clostridia bacterium]
MPRINVLPKNIADLIAAGEVVERPSSVIKEFVENSIDAGSKNITVEIQNGGKTYIRVTDNGCGIERDDVSKAFISHATSKIKDIVDLDAISTLGFRGEALASVCAVSRVEMLTKTEDADVGTRYVIEGGEEMLIDDAGCPVGTTLVVRDLFYNIPARLKFLKKDVQEGNYIASIVEKIAVSNPSISFKFIREGKLQFSTPGDGNLKSAIYAVFGKDFTENLLPVENSQNGITVKGFTTKPTSCRSSRSMQIFYVNNRYVKSVVFLSALEAAYKNSIMVGKYPGCVLFIDLPFEAVDVNVHPAKTEVRFYDEKRIFDCIYNGVLSAITDDKSRLQATFSTAKAFMKPAEKGEQLKFNDIPVVKSDEPVAEIKTEKTVFVKEFGNISGSDGVTLNSPKKDEPGQLDFLKDSIEKPLVTKISFNDSQAKVDSVIIKENVIDNSLNKEIYIPDNKSSAVDFDNSLDKNIDTGVEIRIKEKTENFEEIKATEVKKTTENISVSNTPEFKFIGEAFNTYLIAELVGKMVIIDKHAAHERFLFEKFKKEGSGNSQIMLQPITVNLSADEYNAVIENSDLLYDAGYEISDFGDRCVKVNACPPELTDSNLYDIILEIAGYLANNVKTLLPEKLDWIYHSMACRAAVKAGNFTSKYEAEMFVKHLLSRDDIRYCPHGRPVMIEMTQRELEKQFKRIV